MEQQDPGHSGHDKISLLPWRSSAVHVSIPVLLSTSAAVTIRHAIHGASHDVKRAATAARGASRLRWESEQALGTWRAFLFRTAGSFRHAGSNPNSRTTGPPDHGQQSDLPVQPLALAQHSICTSRATRTGRTGRSGPGHARHSGTWNASSQCESRKQAARDWHLEQENAAGRSARVRQPQCDRCARGSTRTLLPDRADHRPPRPRRDSQ